MSQLQKYAPGLGILAALLLGYGSVLIELVKDWARDPNYSHGFLIPVVSIYLIWNNRLKIRETAAAPSLWGLIGLLVGAALLIVGAAGAEVFIQRISFILVLGSLALYFHGRARLLLIAFPLVFLLLAIPLPYIIYYSLTGPMQAFAAKCAIWGLQVVGVQAIAQGNMIHLSNTSLEVAEACSGIRSLYAFLAVGALVAHSTPISLWGRLLVFFVAIPLSVAGNAVRVWGSGMGACLIGPEATEGTVHEMFGLLVFAVSLGIFILFRKVAGKLWSSDTSSPSSSLASRDSMPESFAPPGKQSNRFPTSPDSPER